MRKYSTVEVAKILGLHQPALQRAIARGRVTPPPLIRVGRIKIRLWAPRDVERARRQLKKTRNGRRKKAAPRSAAALLKARR